VATSRGRIVGLESRQDVHCAVWLLVLARACLRRTRFRRRVIPVLYTESPNHFGIAAIDALKQDV
jgi:hypothetical protein